MSEREPHFGPRPQTDLEAANSAEPDTERKPYGDDPEWDAYLFAVDPDYRIDWFLDHGDEESARDEVEEMRERKMEDGDWSDADEEDYIAGWCDDDDEDNENPVLAADEADMAQIAREWAEYDRDPPGS